RVIPAETIVKYESKLAKLLFGIRSPNEPNRRFGVSPVSGCISYFDDTRLWKNTNAGSLPPSPQAAEQEARKFFQKKAKELSIAGLPQLFPAGLKPLATRAAFAPGRQYADHWLT